MHLKPADGSTVTTADFEAALRLVEFNNTSETPSESTRTVTFTVTDAAATGDETAKTHTATRDVTVQATEDKPVIDMDNPSGWISHIQGMTTTQLIRLIRQLPLMRCREQIQQRMRRHLVRLFQT